MPRLTFKETITKEIDIPLDQLFTIIDQLSSIDKEKLMERLQMQPIKLKPFKKDSAESILGDFASLDIYEEGFLKDLEKGLKASSVASSSIVSQKVLQAVIARGEVTKQSSGIS